MPNCRKCGGFFARRIYIDGKQRILTNRVYCLTCSEFNKHNTKRLHEPPKTESTRLCGRCGKNNKYKTKICPTCRSIIRRQEIKRKGVAYKGGKCIICGYHKCQFVLSFHHLDSKQKKFNISACHGYSWKNIKDEIDKCVLLCANCHIEVERGITQLPNNLPLDDKTISFPVRQKLGKIERKIEKKDKKEQLRKSKRPPKEILYQQLWMMPTTWIAELYGVCDNAVAKWAKYYKLDKPPRGFWAKRYSQK